MSQKMVLLAVLQFALVQGKLRLTSCLSSDESLHAGQGDLLTEPLDQQVVLGKNAVFYCNTRSTKAYWRVNNNTFEFAARYSNFPEYNYSNSSDNTFFNISLTVLTSENVTTLTIRCFYLVSSHEVGHSRIAHLITLSCLG